MASCWNLFTDNYTLDEGIVRPGRKVVRKPFYDEDGDELFVENREDLKPGFWLNKDDYQRGGLMFDAKEGRKLIAHLTRVLNASLKKKKAKPKTKPKKKAKAKKRAVLVF